MDPFYILLGIFFFPFFRLKKGKNGQFNKHTEVHVPFQIFNISFSTVVHLMHAVYQLASVICCGVDG